MVVVVVVMWCGWVCFEVLIGVEVCLMCGTGVWGVLSSVRRTLSPLQYWDAFVFISIFISRVLYCFRNSCEGLK